MTEVVINNRKKIYPRNIIEEHQVSTIVIKKFKAYFNANWKHYTIRLVGKDLPILLEKAIEYYKWDVLQARSFLNDFYEIVKKAEESKKSIFVIYESDLYDNQKNANQSWNSVSSDKQSTEETKEEKKSKTKKKKSK